MVRRIDTEAVIDAVRLEEQASDPSTPASGYGALYGKTDGCQYYIGDDGVVRLGGFFEGARVYNSANISIVDNTLVALTFDSESWDTNGYHSTVSNTSRLTAPVAGKYLYIGNARFATNGTNDRYFAIRLNGTDYIDGTGFSPNTSAIRTFGSLSGIYSFAANDYIELLVYQNSGGALNIEQGAGGPSLTMIRIG